MPTDVNAEVAFSCAFSTEGNVIGLHWHDKLIDNLVGLGVDEQIVNVYEYNEVMSNEKTRVKLQRLETLPDESVREVGEEVTR